MLCNGCGRPSPGFTHYQVVPVHVYIIMAGDDRKEQQRSRVLFIIYHQTWTAMKTIIQSLTQSDNRAKLGYPDYHLHSTLSCSAGACKTLFTNVPVKYWARALKALPWLARRPRFFLPESGTLKKHLGLHNCLSWVMWWCSDVVMQCFEVVMMQWYGDDVVMWWCSDVMM